MRAHRRGRSSHSNGGGLGAVLLGFMLTVAGGFLLTNQVQVGSGPFGGWAWFGPNSFGLLLVPLLVGVALLSFNRALLIGRLLAGGGAIVLLASILDTLRITFRPTSLFNTLLMLGLLVAGLGLLARRIVGVSSSDVDDDHEVEVREALQSNSQLSSGRKQGVPGPASAKAMAGPETPIDDELAEMIRAKKVSPDSLP